MLRAAPLVAILVAGCSADYSGSYVSCPYPDFSATRLTLDSAGGAYLRFSYDVGPTITIGEGVYSRAGDEIVLKLETFTRTVRDDEPITSDDPTEVRLGNARRPPDPVLGPLSTAPVEGEIATARTLLVRYGEAGAELLREVECPAELDSEPEASSPESAV